MALNAGAGVVRAENAGAEDDWAENAGALGVIELNAGRALVGTAGGREAAGGGGGGAAAAATGFSSSHASAGADADFPYKDPADGLAPKAGLFAVGKGGFAAGGGAFLIAAISGLPTGV
jgi:hypothetical protein